MFLSQPLDPSFLCFSLSSLSLFVFDIFLLFSFCHFPVLRNFFTSVSLALVVASLPRSRFLCPLPWPFYLFFCRQYIKLMMHARKHSTQLTLIVASPNSRPHCVEPQNLTSLHNDLWENAVPTVASLSHFFCFLTFTETWTTPFWFLFSLSYNTQWFCCCDWFFKWISECRLFWF